MISTCEFNHMIECSPWWQWSSGLNDRPQQGKHHMTQTGSLLKMENKCDTLFSLLMFYVVKRSNISALDALISVESRAAWETETERKVGGWRVFLLFWHPPLCHQRSDTLLLLFKKKKKKTGFGKVHHGNRGIWWQEAFWEVARADITHPIMQCSKQLPVWNKTLIS